MKSNIHYLLFLLLLLSCNDDNIIIEEPVELITTLNYKLVPQGGGNTVTLSFQDLDGDGGNAPIVTGGSLKPNSSYSGTLELVNEAESPAIDISNEIFDEKEDHQFFFEATSLNASITYDDLDANSLPVGLSTVLTTGEISSGSIKITLRHEPEKAAPGASDGDITNAGGETDIEVTFIVSIEN